MTESSLPSSPLAPQTPQNPQSPSRTRPRRPTRSIPATPSQSIVAGGQQEEHATLTPLRAHYLKKYLIQLQFQRELDDITNAPADNASTLAYLGPPFSPPKGSAPLDLPFLRYIFRQFILTFPFMEAAPKDFYSEKLQPFVASAFAKNISPSSLLDDDSGSLDQPATRLKLLSKVERNLALFIGAGLKVAEPEEVVRLTQVDLDRLEHLAARRQARLQKNHHSFEVNIISVRVVTDKGRVRSRAHEEFIIRTRLSPTHEVVVSRRYGDFKTLANELRKAHPQEPVADPPAKDRSTSSVPPSSTMHFLQRTQSPGHDDSFSNDSHESLPQSPSNSSMHNQSRLAREKNRLTLRAYLHSLMTSAAIVSSPVLRSFLLSGPTTLAVEEQEDARRREEADRMREEGRKQFAHEIATRVDGLRAAVQSVKGDIMGKDGLTRVFATIKVTPDVRDLPPNYLAVLEWARISLASTLFHVLVAADNASETFASVKRIHGLMPYFVLKTALRISNPVGMIRSVLDIFLAQPFGGRSLLQRMFTGSLSEEVKALEEDIEMVVEKIKDTVLCEKIRLYIYAPREIQDMYREDADQERINILTVILRSGDEPRLDRVRINRVMRAHQAHNIYMRQREQLADSDDDDGPQNDDAWLYEDLKILLQLYSRLRDREQLIALIFEGVTADLLKDMITIFYAPLAQVYRAASIADSLGDLQNFINDLIRTVEQSEELAQEDPQRTVQVFIDLVQRHEQAFYNFVHKVHSKGEGLFDGLMRWIELFLTVVREGLGEPIRLEFLLPHGGEERSKILTEVDAMASYHYKMKVAYEAKIRRRFGRSKGHVDADTEDAATQALVSSVVGEINFGEIVQGDAADLAAEDSEDDDSEQESSEYETGSNGEDESSSEENLPPALPVARSRTIHPAPTPSQSAERPPIRPRSTSLKTARSMSSMRSAHSPSPSSAPPVPPLPDRFNKPLPRSPQPIETPSIRRRSAEEHRAPPNNGRVHPVNNKPKSKHGGPVLTPPKLVHIPQLLPIFVEMVRPHLRPRPK
ncbi:hypothetical protein CONPUDRAFT_146665 [Coniophora puteana RWD-64-598 SS2]|uniref:PX domain-containing protein n=1 Tax=Coniophora puteana (strain RWD-64-598) TaxID=741705 RepID=A0A5M3MB64_CONPW|nr:uncharacterized protein CONPUDRAFT_146665 [Coniophora puteana RWD-64-598 SS2]EIW76124.1 hypothetical protein CONPUDRAFT_146665 [Coniophora puteana RWD-64-598 SS2]